MCILSEHFRRVHFEEQAHECTFSQKEQTLTRKKQNLDIILQK